MTSVSTLTRPTHAKSVYNATSNTYNGNIKQPKIDGDEILKTESDAETGAESEYSISNQKDAEYSSNNESTSVSSLSKAAFIVYWSSLTVLLNKC